MRLSDFIIDCTRPNIASEGFVGIGELHKNFRKYRDLMLDVKGLQPGQRLKYGCESLTPETFYATMAASVTFYPLSSYFVTMNSSGNAILTVASSTSIQGHLICPAGAFGTQGTNTYYTTSSVAGGETWPCIYGLDARFRIPVSSGTYSRGNRGKLCDLAVATGVQGAATQTSVHGHIQLLDGDEVNNLWVIARINPGLISAGNAS